MQNLIESIRSLISSFKEDVHLESAWLDMLAHMEHMVSSQTSEYGHWDLILNLRPYPLARDSRFEQLRTRLRAISKSFVQGDSHIFSGASAFLTLVYSVYLEESESPRIREALQEILNDSGDFRDLTDSELQKCFLLLQRLTDVTSDFLNFHPEIDQEKASQRLVQMISTRSYATQAWIEALGHTEFTSALHLQRIYHEQKLTLPKSLALAMSEDVRHARMLQRSVLKMRQHWLVVPGYCALERQLAHEMDRYVSRFLAQIKLKITSPEKLHLYGAWGLEMRRVRHYAEVLQHTDNIGIAQVLSGILEDETKYARMIQEDLFSKGLMEAETLKWVRQQEDLLFEHFAERLVELLESYDLQKDRNKDSSSSLTMPWPF